MDTSKSLAELSGTDWGPAPEATTLTMRERHEVRRQPIRDLPDYSIAHLLDLGGDSGILIQIALARLAAKPEATGILCAVLRTDAFDWRSEPEYVHRVREAVGAALNEIGQITDDLERLQLEATVHRGHAQFERRLSSI